MKKNYVTLLFSAIIICSFIIFNGCSASKEGKETATEIKTPPSSDKFEYKMDIGKEYKYSTLMDVKNTVTMMGQEQISNVKIAGNVNINPDAVLPVGYSAIMTADSLKVESDSPQMPDLSGELLKMNSKKFKAVIHKNGKITDIQQIDEFGLDEKMKAILGEMLDLKTKFKNLLFVMPDKVLKVGDTWTEVKNDTTPRMGGKVYSVSTNEFSLAGKENIGGKDVYKISLKSKIDLSGTGSQMNQEFTISGKGKATIDYYFSKDEGLFLSCKGDQAMDMSIDIASMGMTMPIATITTTTIKLIK
jgi:hypothetical protein